MSKGHFKKSRFAKKIYIIFLISAENVLKKSEKLFIICFGIINYLFIEVNMKNRKLHKVFKRMPTLTTERLVLRPMSTSDAWDMYEYAHREDVTEFLLWSPHPSVSYTRDYLAYIESRYAACEFYDWAITLADSGKMIGTAGFTKINTDHNVGEIGYVLSPEYHGKGLGFEAARRVVDFGFEQLELHRIEAKFMQGNAASLHVMEKLGMTFEGYQRDSMLVKGKYRTIGYCSILADEYSSHKIH